MALTRWRHGPHVPSALSVSRSRTMTSVHGWLFVLDGARRPASRIAVTSASASTSHVNSRTTRRPDRISTSSSPSGVHLPAARLEGSPGHSAGRVQPRRAFDGSACIPVAPVPARASGRSSPSGPTFAFSIIGAMGGKEPQHANFATRSLAHDRRSGSSSRSAIIHGDHGRRADLVRGIDLVDRANWWLIAIVLYVIAVGYAFFVQRGATDRVIEMTSTPPPPGAEPARRRSCWR